MNNNFKLKQGSGIWEKLLFRENPQDAFVGKSDKIKLDYMYMYSNLKYDYFKHKLTRGYIKFKHGIKKAPK